MIDFLGLIKRHMLYLLPFYQYLKVRRLRKRKQINIVFFAMSVSMWRYQNLYELLSRHPRFNVSIVIQPCVTYSAKQQKEDADALVAFFKDRGVPYIMGFGPDGEYVNVRKTLSPDILFYPQPYGDYYPEALEFRRFYDKLLCYYPYAFWMSQGAWSYNQPLHKTAWKLFYPTDLHRKDAEAFSERRGKNMEIVGYPTSDQFLSGHFTDVWKPQRIRKKRVIWAPHFTIFSEGYVAQANFLWMADLMLEICEKYSDTIQFVFKPHPRLFTELCRHGDWGEEKAAAYYQKWAEMPNSQVETEGFIDLFMTSDAMIHDSGSFCVEYHYTGCPVMFVSKEFSGQLSGKNDFGKLAMNLHYIGQDLQDIVAFIEETVLKGNDPMKQQRLQFRNDYLLPPNGKTVAENTMDILLRELC